MAGAHGWQSIRLVANITKDLIPDVPAVNGLYVVRLSSIQAYVGMSVPGILPGDGRDHIDDRHSW